MMPVRRFSDLGPRDARLAVSSTRFSRSHGLRPGNNRDRRRDHAVRADLNHVGHKRSRNGRRPALRVRDEGNEAARASRASRPPAAFSVPDAEDVGLIRFPALERRAQLAKLLDAGLGARRPEAEDDRLPAQPLERQLASVPSRSGTSGAPSFAPTSVRNARHDTRPPFQCSSTPSRLLRIQITFFAPPGRAIRASQTRSTSASRPGTSATELRSSPRESDVAPPPSVASPGLPEFVTVDHADSDRDEPPFFLFLRGGHLLDGADRVAPAVGGGSQRFIRPPWSREAVSQDRHLAKLSSLNLPSAAWLQRREGIISRQDQTEPAALDDQESQKKQQRNSLGTFARDEPHPRA